MTLANTKQALKKTRQINKRRANNRWQQSRMTSAIKKVLQAAAASNLTLAQSAYRDATAIIDRMASKGLIHVNKAARHKSRLNAHLVRLATAA